MLFFSIILMLGFSLISVMFITLLERKILSSTQLRLGPTKVFFSGVIQPLLDGLKLIFKENIVAFKTTPMVFYLGPMMFWTSIFFFWWGNSLFFSTSSSLRPLSIFILVVSSISTFAVFLSGWASSSKYSTLGTMRIAAQSVSYEVIFSLIFFILLMYLEDSTLYLEKKIFFFVILFPLLIFWSLSILAESNRAPFDFPEGESELVSGFNIEYSSSLFSIIFIGEYGGILCFSLFTSLLWFPKNLNLMMFFLMIMVYIFSRATLPRFKFNFYMELTWTRLLPLVILFFWTPFILFFYII